MKLDVEIHPQLKNKEKCQLKNAKFNGIPFSGFGWDGSP
jgi:hypothetical protein